MTGLVAEIGCLWDSLTYSSVHNVQWKLEQSTIRCQLVIPETVFFDFSWQQGFGIELVRMKALHLVGSQYAQLQFQILDCNITMLSVVQYEVAWEPGTDRPVAYSQ